MNDDYDRATPNSRGMGPLGAWFAGAAVVCAVCLIPIVRTVYYERVRVLWLLPFACLVAIIVVILIVGALRRSSRRPVAAPNLEQLLAVGRAVFAGAVLGFVCAVWATRGAQGAVLATGAVAVTLVVLTRLAQPPLAQWRRRKLAIGWKAADLITLNLAIAVVAFEVACRFAAQHINSPLLARKDLHEERMIQIHRFGPHHPLAYGLPVNSLGYFDDEFTTARGPDEFRVAVMADSFGAHYVQLDQVFPNRTEQILNQGADGVDWQVLNFAIAGIGPREYLYLVKNEADAFDPDLHVIALFLGNDLEIEPKVTRPGWLDPERWYFCILPWRIYRIQWERQQRKAEGIAARPISELGLADRAEERAPTLSLKASLHAELRHLFPCAKEEPDPFDPLYEELGRILEEAKAVAQGRLMVFLIPSHVQIDPVFLKAVCRQFPPLKPEQFDMDRPNRKVAAVCERLGIVWVDATEAIRSADKKAPTYIRNDTHWSALGHDVGARVLAEAIGKWRASRAGEASEARP